MDRAAGKIALVTGGAGGIGCATVRALLREGATVIIADMPDALDAAQSAGIYGSVSFHPLDVTSEESWKQVVEQSVAAHGGIDILINAAGIEGDVINGTPETTSLAEWRKVMAVNLDGTFLGCREVLPVMRRKGRGSIVNLSSVASYLATLTSAAYGASKGGVTQLTKSVALYGTLEGMRIRCNSVHPGMIATRMIDSIFGQMAERNNLTVEESMKGPLSRVPYGEPGRAEDVADLILFLASDEADYITGSEFTVDGGWRLGGAAKAPMPIPR